MNSRLEMVSVEEARRLGVEIGIGEAQASRSAFRMLGIILTSRGTSSDC